MQPFMVWCFSLNTIPNFFSFHLIPPLIQSFAFHCSVSFTFPFSHIPLWTLTAYVQHLPLRCLYPLDTCPTWSIWHSCPSSHYVSSPIYNHLDSKDALFSLFSHSPFSPVLLWIPGLANLLPWVFSSLDSSTSSWKTIKHLPTIQL